MTSYKATVDIFYVNILADSMNEAKDIFMEKSVSFPTVRKGDKIFIRLGEAGKLGGHDIEVIFTKGATYEFNDYTDADDED
jgi:ADP-dependent phosphofructokinase/glucokinase